MQGHAREGVCPALARRGRGRYENGMRDGRSFALETAFFVFCGAACSSAGAGSIPSAPTSESKVHPDGG